MTEPLAGSRPAVLRALYLIEEMGPALDLHVNLAKCELLSRNGNTSFPSDVRCSFLPNLDILGAPIGDYLYCSKFIAGKCAESRKLLSGLVGVAAVDLQVAVTLLHMCGSFCTMVHIARVTSPSLASDGPHSKGHTTQPGLRWSTWQGSPHPAWPQVVHIARVTPSSLASDGPHGKGHPIQPGLRARVTPPSLASDGPHSKGHTTQPGLRWST